MIRKFILFVLMILMGNALFGQGLVEIPVPGIDTLSTDTYNIPAATRYSPALVTPQFLGICLQAPELKVSTLNFDYFLHQKSFAGYQVSERSFLNTNSVFYPNTAMGFSPFMVSSSVLNQAAYRLSDKFVVGGNSFGATSIFSAPLSHPGSNRFDTRGASMFMQYKVSKNFKIETRVSVTNHDF